MFRCSCCGFPWNNILAQPENIRFECYGYYKQIVKCADCQLVQLFPPWTEEELNELYSKYSLKKDFNGQKRKKNIPRYLKKYLNKKENILEIGCGNADVLDYYRGLGYSVFGIDRDPTVCDHKHVCRCDFPKEKLSVKVDFIYALHVLEHVKNPKEFLLEMMDSLNDSGRFVLELPNVEDPLLTLYKNKKYNRFYWYPYHLFFYDMETLTSLFKSVNIDVEVKRIQRYGILNHLRWIILGRPGNLNFKVPILDRLYSWILCKVFKKSDTLLVVGKK